MYTTDKKTFTAGEALAAHCRVKIDSAVPAANPAEVIYADAGEDFIGVTEYAAADGDPIAIRMNSSSGTFEVSCVVDSSIVLGTVLYGAASGQVSDAVSGTAQGICIEPATVTDDDIIEVAFWNVKSTTAGTVSHTDAGNFTTAATVEAALQEIYQHIISAKGIINIPMPTITNAGVALAAFSNASEPLPGFCVTAEGLGIRWNNHATPTPVGTKVIIPPDMDVAADAVLHILAAKTGATDADDTKFTIEAFNNDVGAAYDADEDFGGDTDAMVGTATAKTVAHLTLTLALANLTAYPAALELTLQPKDGTIETDDVIILAQWIEYTRKLLTA